MDGWLDDWKVVGLAEETGRFALQAARSAAVASLAPRGYCLTQTSRDVAFVACSHCSSGGVVPYVTCGLSPSEDRLATACMIL